MSKCKECMHYRARLTVYKNQINGLPMVLGECTERTFPNGTYAECDAKCKMFKPYAVLYNKGDVLSNDRRCVWIECIQPEYYPRLYRVRDRHNGGFSISEDELEKQGYVRIFEEANDE